MKIIGAFPETETPEIWMNILSIYTVCIFITQKRMIIIDSGFSTTVPSLQRYMFLTGFGRRPGSFAVRVEWDFRWQYLQASSWSYIFDPRWSIISCITSKLLWDMIMGWRVAVFKINNQKVLWSWHVDLLGLGSSGVALQSSKTPSGLYRHHRTSTEMVFQSWNLRRKKQHMKIQVSELFSKRERWWLDGNGVMRSWGSWWKQSSFVLILSILPPMVQVGFLSSVITSSCFFSSVYPAQWRKILQFDLHIFLTMGE